MKILVADKFESFGIDRLKAVASELVFEPELKDDALKAKLAEFDPKVLIVRSTKVPEAVMSAGEHLDVIIRAGSGFDTIDIDAAGQHGIRVANCPGMNASAVAELVVGLMIGLDRKIPENVIDLRAHKWNKKLYSSQAQGLRGRVFGLIGAGRVGHLVAEAVLAMGMHVRYYHLGRRPFFEHPNVQREELDDVIREADVLSIHVPGGPSTHHLLDAQRLAMMKPTALLINTSRAGIVDEEAVGIALKEGKLRGAAFDVYPNEPAANDQSFEGPMAAWPNFIGTHHIGASTAQAQMAVAEETVRIVEEFKRTGRVVNCVNVADTNAQCMVVVRLRNKPGGLAHVFKHLAEAGVNAEQMDHVVYDGGKAACAHICVDHTPSDDTIEQIRGDRELILGVDLMRLD